MKKAIVQDALILIGVVLIVFNTNTLTAMGILLLFTEHLTFHH